MVNGPGTVLLHFLESPFLLIRPKTFNMFNEDINDQYLSTHTDSIHFLLRYNPYYKHIFKLTWIRKKIQIGHWVRQFFFTIIGIGINLLKTCFRIRIRKSKSWFAEFKTLCFTVPWGSNRDCDLSFFNFFLWLHHLNLNQNDILVFGIQNMKLIENVFVIWVVSQ
jgi:hypothetical protein